jgi:acyl-CoA dehydrogenase
MKAVAELERERAMAIADWPDVLTQLAPDLEAEGRACDRDGRFVAKNLDRLEANGFFALAVPADLGGGGLAYAELCAMLRALGRIDGSTALALSMHTHQVAVAEWRRRVGGQPTEGLLRKVADGTRLLSSGGSDWLAGSGRAEQVEGGWKIHGRKVFSSGAPDGDLMMTSAIAGDEVLHFALPMGGEQVRVTGAWDTLGMRGTGSHDVEIAGAFVADAAISGRRPAGRWHPLFHLIGMIAFPLIYSVYAGVADAARQEALRLAGARAGADPIRLYKIGEMENTHASMNLAHAAMVEAGAGGTPGPATTNRVMTLRALVGRAAVEVGERALDCAGGAGFHRSAGIEQRFRDLQAARFHPLQDGAQQVYAARTALGLDIDG